jgi:hypothetical protein
MPLKPPPTTTASNRSTAVEVMCIPTTYEQRRCGVLKGSTDFVRKNATPKMGTRQLYANSSVFRTIMHL